MTTATLTPVFLRSTEPDAMPSTPHCEQAERIAIIRQELVDGDPSTQQLKDWKEELSWLAFQHQSNPSFPTDESTQLMADISTLISRRNTSILRLKQR